MRHGGARKDLPGPFVEIIDKKLGQKLDASDREGGLDISIYGPRNQDGGSGSQHSPAYRLEQASFPRFPYSFRHHDYFSIEWFLSPISWGRMESRKAVLLKA